METANNKRVNSLWPFHTCSTHQQLFVCLRYWPSSCSCSLFAVSLLHVYMYMLSERPTIAVKCVDAKQSFADSPVHVVTGVKKCGTASYVACSGFYLCCCLFFSFPPPVAEKTEVILYKEVLCSGSRFSKAMKTLHCAVFAFLVCFYDIWFLTFDS